MRSGMFFTTALSLVFLSTSVFTAPLVDGLSPSPTQNRTARAEVPVKPAFLPPAGRSLADLDANGLSDGLEQLLATKGRDEPVDVIVTFSGPGNGASAQRAVGAFSVYREFSLISGFAATMTAGQARALANAAGVFRVEEDAIAYINLEASRRDFGVESLRDAGLSPEITGAGVKVCVLDTGVQHDHEQFTDGGLTRVVGFLDLTGDFDGNFNDCSDPKLISDPNLIIECAYDDHGHGTHVSGIIGGDGVAGTTPKADKVRAPLARGVAPGVELYVAKVLNYNGSGANSGIIDGLDWCVNVVHADVANLSLGISGSSDGQDALSLAVNAAVKLGTVVVVAAGNAGDGEATIGSPGAAARAISVGAVAEHSASTEAAATSLGVYPAPFSSHGPTLDGRIKPDVAAPGVSVLSAMTTWVSIDQDLFWGGGPYNLGYGEGGYIILSGTSMASPFVAGAVALMLQADASLTPDQVHQILAGTAQERGATGMDNVLGHGLVDVYAAVSEAAGPEAGTESTVFPYHAFQKGTVPDNTAVRIPIRVVDMNKPLAVTVSIEGKLTRWGWSPDIDIILLDQMGKPFMIDNPLYFLLGGEPFLPAPGTSSTCPAGEDCGRMGTQETIHILPNDLQPGIEDFFIEIYPYADRPNRGKGGNFTIGLSNGYFPGPVDGQLVADAGSDVTVTDDDGDGSAEVVLDGRASRGLIAEYHWYWTDQDDNAIDVQGAVLKVKLPTGDNFLTLPVADENGPGVPATVTVTVLAPSTDSGGTGGGKPCNPKKKNC